MKNLGLPATVAAFIFVPIYAAIEFIFPAPLNTLDATRYTNTETFISIGASLALIIIGLARLRKSSHTDRYDLIQLSALTLATSIWLYISIYEFSIYWISLIIIGQLVVLRYQIRGAIVYSLYMILYVIFYMTTKDVFAEATLTSNSYFAFILILFLALLVAQLFNDILEKHFSNLTIARRRYQDEHQLSLTLMNSISDSIIAVDNQMRITVYNSSFLDLVDLNILETNTPLKDALKLVNQYGDVVDLELRIKESDSHFQSDELLIAFEDDEQMNVDITATPILDNEGDSTGHTITLRDITKQKSLEQEKDEFISVVSHELRTPLTVAEGGVSNVRAMLRKQISPSPGRDAVMKMVDTAHEEVLALAEIINDLSTLSRAERNIKEGSIEPINVGQLVQRLSTQYEKPAAKKNLDVCSVVEDSIDEDFTIVSNELYLREILQNFMTNSIKYTVEGSVTIGVKQLDLSHVEFYVSDTGIGISRSDQKKIFDKFFRSEDYRTRENGGTGLGLYVTKKLASMIGAEIGVESQLNKGTTMSLIIPFELKD